MSKTTKKAAKKITKKAAKKITKKAAKVAKPKVVKGSTEQWNGIGGPPIAEKPSITGDVVISKVQRIDGEFALWMIAESKRLRTNVTSISRLVHQFFTVGGLSLDKPPV